jgi:hypothetical protein
MLKSLAALAMLALLGASVVALPYISRVEAGETVALAKGNRSDARTDCSQQVWPNISSHCLRGDRAESEVRLLRRSALDRVVLITATVTSEFLPQGPPGFR